MKAKQILCGTLAALMLAGSCFSASAAQITNSGEAGQTLVTYGMSEGFVVTIPTDFTIDDSAMAEASVFASDVMISYGSTLEVSVSGNDYINKWELIDIAEDDNRLEYTIGTSVGGRDIVNNSVVLSVAAGEAFNSTVKEVMYFTVVDELSKAGTYKDTLTFNVGVYTLSEGNGQQYNAASPTALSFRSTKPIDEFEDVYLNDELVNSDNYTVTEGSTIVTFKESFLATLPNGNYRVSFKFTNSTTSASFRVVGSSVEADTEQDKTLAAGLYDENDVLIASWEELGMDESYLDGTTILANYPTGKKLVVLQGYVGSSGFYGVSNIEEIILLDGVSGIGNAAFSYMTHLKKITIPTSVTMILYAPFENVYTLTDVYYEGTMEQFESIQFNEYWMNATNATTNLHCSDGTVKFSQITVDETGKTTINKNGENANDLVPGFYDDSGNLIADWDTIEALNSNHDKTLGTIINDSYPNATKVVIDSSIDSYGSSSGYVTSVEIYECHNIKEIIVLDGVTGLGNQAFSDNNNLVSITLPNTIESFLYGPFVNCPKLKDIYYNGTTSEWHDIDKGDSWEHIEYDFTVHCIDGDIVY